MQPGQTASVEVEKPQIIVAAVRIPSGTTSVGGQMDSALLVEDEVAVGLDGKPVNRRLPDLDGDPGELPPGLCQPRCVDLGPPWRRGEHL